MGGQAVKALITKIAKWYLEGVTIMVIQLQRWLDYFAIFYIVD